MITDGFGLTTLPTPKTDSRPREVVLAFDSFKGSLSSEEACRCVGEALHAKFGTSIRVIHIPMSDGGEGSLDLLAPLLGLDVVRVDSVDALGRPITCEYLLDTLKSVAYIEVARTAGLPQVSDVPLKPLEASSFGVGVIIADALRRGAQELNIFLGGSATTDGGAGLVSALGVKLIGRGGMELSPGGGALGELERVDTEHVNPSVFSAQWRFITDIDAHLTGENGPARRYSPQKGAQPGDVQILERSIEHLARVLETQHGCNLRNLAGIGAAGGMAALPAALFETSFQRGGMFFATQLGLVDAMKTADIVVTGEGAFDQQSLDGKVVGTIAELVAQHERVIPVVVIAGDVSEAPSGDVPGITAVFSIAEGAVSREELFVNARSLLTRQALNVVSLFLQTRIPGRDD